MKRETDGDMIQSAVRLPRRLHERLKNAGGERGMGEEIRRRLEASFDAEPSDRKTRELLEGVAFCARQATNYYGRWSEDGFAFLVLKASVDMLLKSYQPKHDPLPKPNPTKLGKVLFEENGNPSPEEISRTVMSLWRDQLYLREQEG